MRVLWLDDERSRIEVFAEVLIARGHVVELVSRVEDFEKKIGASEFDTAIIDVMLPTAQYGSKETDDGVDTGLLVAKNVQSKFPEVRVILLTNRMDIARIHGDHEFEVYRKIQVTPRSLADKLEGNSD